MNSLRHYFILTAVVLFVMINGCYEQFKTVFILNSVMLVVMDAMNSLREYFILTTVMPFLMIKECYEQFETVFYPHHFSVIP